MTAKEFLEQYKALNAEIIQIEHELGELAAQPTHLETDCVLGSPAHEPYQNMPMPIAGYVQSTQVQKARQKVVDRYNRQLDNLYQGRDKAERLIAKVGDAKARTIIRYRYVDGMEWNDIADVLHKQDGKSTEGSVKMYARRYLEKIL